MGKDQWFNKFDVIATVTSVVATVAGVVGMYCGYKGNQQRIAQLNSQVDPVLRQTPPKAQP